MFRVTCIIEPGQLRQCLASSFCYPDGFKPASRQKIGVTKTMTQGRWMGLHAFQGTGSNSYTSACPVLIVCHKLPNLSTIDDKELQFFTDWTQVNYTTPHAWFTTLTLRYSHTGPVFCAPKQSSGDGNENTYSTCGPGP